MNCCDSWRHISDTVKLERCWIGVKQTFVCHFIARLRSPEDNMDKKIFTVLESTGNYLVCIIMYWGGLLCAPDITCTCNTLLQNENFHKKILCAHEKLSGAHGIVFRALQKLIHFFCPCPRRGCVLYHPKDEQTIWFTPHTYSTLSAVLDLHQLVSVAKLHVSSCLVWSAAYLSPRGLRTGSGWS